MLVCYLRSSSLGTYEMCEQKYFMNYVLGLPDKENGKAILGSVLHKNFELLAKYKLALQNGHDHVMDDTFGRMEFKDFTVPKLNELSHNYYEANFPGIMPPKAIETTLDWTYIALTRVNGELDPRNQTIEAVEEFFEIEIPHEWAKYQYFVGDELIEGQLGIKGTVDLILKEDDIYFHVLDYKGLPVETLIPTIDGWSTMGDLKVGDIVFDQYGNNTKVVVKSRQKIVSCYQIVFDDGVVVECDIEHYWKLSDGTVVDAEDLCVGDSINVSPIEFMNYNKTRIIMDIIGIGKKITQCIGVDSPDQTYLCTKNLVPTHNTGKRLNWATDKVKTYEDLQVDKQLLLYYYALRVKYPDRRFHVSIYYTNDHKIEGQMVEGGLFSFTFGDAEFQLAEKMLKDKFETIRDNVQPKLLSEKNIHWKCKYLCAYSKIIPSISKEIPACLFVRDAIKKNGISAVTDEFADRKKMTRYTGGGRLDVELE